MLRPSPLLFLLAASFFLWPLTLAAKEKKGRPPPAVAIAQVTQRSVAPMSRVSGTVIPLLETVVAARVAGSVSRIWVEPGDRVKRGAKLVTLDPQEAQREVAAKEAAVAEALARLEKARKDLSRDRKLSGTDLISKRRLADSEAEVAIRTPILARAKAELGLARDRLAWHRITAPFDGVVSTRSAQTGQWIDRGDPVASLMDPDHLEIRAMIPGHLAVHLVPGAQAEAFLARDVGAPADESVSFVTLRATVPRNDPISRNRPTFWQRDALPGVVAGDEVQLQIASGPPKTFPLLPKDAVVRDRDRVFVYVLTGESVQPHNVTLGEAVADRFQVLDGVEVGAQVVVRGNERLRPGQTVRVLADEPSP
ncbi:MAG: efflux RND transporter periplasmic adaptor subunit [Magnetococcales bacterium]|nr:efflux RND transporter periplasmic adaptor subunit [Magnetococcales bacterium]